MGAAYWFASSNRQEARAVAAEERAGQNEQVIKMLADEVKSCHSDRSRAMDMVDRMQAALDTK